MFLFKYKNDLKNNKVTKILGDKTKNKRFKIRIKRWNTIFFTRYIVFYVIKFWANTEMA